MVCVCTLKWGRQRKREGEGVGLCKRMPRPAITTASRRNNSSPASTYFSIRLSAERKKRSVSCRLKVHAWRRTQRPEAPTQRIPVCVACDCRRACFSRRKDSEKWPAREGLDLWRRHIAIRWFPLFRRDGDGEAVRTGASLLGEYVTHRRCRSGVLSWLLPCMSQDLPWPCVYFAYYLTRLYHIMSWAAFVLFPGSHSEVHHRPRRTTNNPLNSIYCVNKLPKLMSC